MNIDAILITGPTASGKSAYALEMAEKYGGEIINADSMQVYDTLHRLTARPFEQEMGGIVHRLYGTVPASKLFSTGDWLRAAETAIAEICKAGRVPVVVGGTGLYFRALTGGLSDMPDVPRAVREGFRTRLAEEGPQALHAELLQKDPETGSALKPGDGQRIARALEVLAASGRSIREFQGKSGHAIIDEKNARKIIIQPDRQILRQRINRRFEAMLEQGAIDEVKALLGMQLAPDLPVMKAIGVPQIAAYLAGKMTYEEVVLQASAATRQYAKRQMTWFRNQMDEGWERIDPDDRARSIV
jgi:tRNA dimethylallyltransferase